MSDFNFDNTTLDQQIEYLDGLTEEGKIKLVHSDNIAKVPFGTLFTKHMFMMDYREGQGWQNDRIVEFHDLSLPPSNSFLH